MAEETVDNENEPATQERVKELEQSLADRDAELAALKKTTGDWEQKYADVVTGYKTLVIQANPEITSELITGDSIKSIDESLEKAKSLVGKVRKSVEKELSRTRVPVGSPGRRASDVSALSPREKIHYGVGGKQ